MKITYNSCTELKDLQSSIACFEESMLHLLGEEPELTIVFYEPVKSSCTSKVYLHYAIFSSCQEIVKTSTFNIAR